jgi:hypothetical protein
MRLDDTYSQDLGLPGERVQPNSENMQLESPRSPSGVQSLKWLILFVVERSASTPVRLRNIEEFFGVFTHDSMPKVEITFHRLKAYICRSELPGRYDMGDLRAYNYVIAIALVHVKAT